MPKTIRGHPFNIEVGAVGIVATEHVPVTRRADHIWVGPTLTCRSGYKAYVTTDKEHLRVFRGARKPRILITAGDAADLRQGDILRVNPNGELMVVWRANEPRGNALFVTPACNCRCIMCPQPPARHSRTQSAVNKEIIRLLPGNVSDICLTGGEPTLLKAEFLELLAACTDRFSSVPLTILSNGLYLADVEMAKDIARVRSERITFCIALYSDIDDIHDEITGLRDSFYRTIKGIQNLALVGIPVEIRHVIILRNCDRLTSFAAFVYRNFPFAAHVAYMGCEMTGLACTNADRVWVDPSDYTNDLAVAVRCLAQRGMNVSIYNHQLCVLPSTAWRYARKSISEWKNIYLPLCASCGLRNECGGFFETSENFVSKRVSPIYQ